MSCSIFFSFFVDCSTELIEVAGGIVNRYVALICVKLGSTNELCTYFFSDSWKFTFNFFPDLRKSIRSKTFLFRSHRRSISDCKGDLALGINMTVDGKILFSTPKNSILKPSNNAIIRYGSSNKHHLLLVVHHFSWLRWYYRSCFRYVLFLVVYSSSTYYVIEIDALGDVSHLYVLNVFVKF